MHVIPMKPYLHSDKFTKMQDTLGAYKLILPQPTPAAGISNVHGGQMEIVTSDIKHGEADLSSGHRLLIGLSMCANFEVKMITCFQFPKMSVAMDNVMKERTKNERVATVKRLFDSANSLKSAATKYTTFS